MSSIRLPPVVPKPNQDCLELHRAFEGLGCDGPAVIRVLAHRHPYQRSEIKTVYKNMFQEELCKRLKSELHRHFEKAMLMWMCDAAERDAVILNGALKCSAPRRNEILIEILCTRSMVELDSIVNTYASLYGSSLQSDIESTLSDSCQKLFVLYLHGNRDDTTDLEPHHTLEEARKLHDAGEGLSTHMDETTFIRILTTRNRRQLCSIFDAYRNIYGHDIQKGLKQINYNGAMEFLQIVRTITKCVGNPANYFAKVLYKSMKGLGTDDDTLIRVIITRAEMDMADIKIAFLQKYKKALATMVSSDTSGNYKKFLLALIGVPY